MIPCAIDLLLVLLFCTLIILRLLQSRNPEDLKPEIPRLLPIFSWQFWANSHENVQHSYYAPTQTTHI